MLKFNRVKFATALERSKGDYTYEGLERQVGVSGSTLNRMVQMQSNPEIDTFLKVVNYMNCNVMDFLDDEGEWINISTLPENKRVRIQAILREQGNISIVPDKD